MKSLHHITHAYFLGIGGIGMSALCRYVLSQGIQVYGYDKTPTPLTQELTALGAQISFDDSVDALPEWIQDKDHGLFVITPAIPLNHPQRMWFEAHNYPLIKRAELLGILTQDTLCLAVAGTHGKTTTSTLLAHILKSLDFSFSAFLGGISSNYQTNYIENASGKLHLGTPITVVEADEFDRSFHQLHPLAAIITAVDPDHLDIYHNEVAFTQAFVKFSQQVTGNPHTHLIVHDQIEIPEFEPALKYGHQVESGYCVTQVDIKNGKYFLTLKHENVTHTFQCGLPGRHNVWNTAAAIAMCHSVLGISFDSLEAPIKSFKGVKRRFEYLIDRETHVVIDDYAHHPEEIRNTLLSIRDLYPDKKIYGIFQPHLFTRTRDFAREFAQELQSLDKLWLLEIYPAREEPIEGITSSYIRSLMDRQHQVEVVTKETVIRDISLEKPEVLVLLGAGDIDTLRNPIMALYE